MKLRYPVPVMVVPQQNQQNPQQQPPAGDAPPV
jgi:hypothetical protein